MGVDRENLQAGFILIVCVALVCGLFYGLYTIQSVPLQHAQNIHFNKSPVCADEHLSKHCGEHLVTVKVWEYEAYPKDKPPLVLNMIPVKNTPYQITSEVLGSLIIAGNTDDNGTLTVPLYSYKQYSLRIDNRTIEIIPKENEYRVFLK